jgi:hypothetical protein
MVSSVLLATAALVAYWIYSIVSGLWKNIAAAKRTGLPYVVARKYQPPPKQNTRCSKLIPHSCQSLQQSLAHYAQAMDPVDQKATCTVVGRLD